MSTEFFSRYRREWFDGRGSARREILAGIFFAGKVRRMFAVNRSIGDDGRTVTYRVSGEIFFASVDRFTSAFEVEAGRPVTL